MPRTQIKDYYQILEVEQGATAEEIKKAYRRLAIRHHPDHNPGDEDSEERFKLISEAYAVLIDQHKRTQYDAARESASQAARQFHQAGERFRQASGPGNRGGFGYSQEDIFKEFFASAQSRQTFDDLAKEFGRAGFRFDERFFQNIFFGGRGVFFGGVFFTGQKNRRPQPDAGPAYRTTFTHQRPKQKVEEPKTTAVTRSVGLIGRIRQGVSRLTDRIKALPAAAQHAGADLHYHLGISLEQARMGATVDLVYPRNGESQRVSIKVPPGAQDGKLLRLRSMGERGPTGKSGDLYLHLRVGP